jgi:hypothetical protein
VIDERIEVAVQFRACGGHRLDEVPGVMKAFLPRRILSGRRFGKSNQRTTALERSRRRFKGFIDAHLQT